MGKCYSAIQKCRNISNLAGTCRGSSPVGDGQFFLQSFLVCIISIKPIHIWSVLIRYGQTSFIRSYFIRIPRHPEENGWLQIHNIRDASNITGVRLSGCLAYPDIFCGKRMCAVEWSLTVYPPHLFLAVPPLITDMIESVAAGEVNAICSAAAYPKPIISIIANGVSVDCNETSTLANGVWTSVCWAYLPMAASDESAHINCTASLPAFTCSEAQDPSVQRACENSTKSVTGLYTDNRRKQTGLSKYSWHAFCGGGGGVEREGGTAFYGLFWQHLDHILEVIGKFEMTFEKLMVLDESLENCLF